MRIKDMNVDLDRSCRVNLVLRSNMSEIHEKLQRRCG